MIWFKVWIFKPIGGSMLASQDLVRFRLTILTMNSASLDNVRGESLAVGEVHNHISNARSQIDAIILET